MSANLWRVWSLLMIGWDVFLWATGRYLLAVLFVAVVAVSLAVIAYAAGHR